jgi:hypothetical protein
MISKSSILINYKRGHTFSDISRIFWVDWPESFDREWQHYEEGGGERDDVFLPVFRIRIRMFWASRIRTWIHLSEVRI